MESNNLFLHMNSDMSNLIPSQGRYIKATNFRPITEYGNSNGALSNIKGNNCELTFPRIRGVYRLKLNTLTTSIFTITINGVTSANIEVTSNTINSEIVERITEMSNCYTGTYSISKSFAVSYSDEYIFIYQQPEYRQCGTFASQEPVITVTQVSGTSKLVFLDNTNTINTVQVSYIPADTDNKTVVIGSTYINEITYLFTCNQINPNNTGQIWSLTYDEATKISIAKLIYNGYLNFSINYPIPSTACKGRYENNNIQRIYWSDNNNPVRSLNVADSNIMTLSVDIINLRPSVNMSIPVLSNIIDNDATTPLKTDATYQCAYRLGKINGALTNYSSPSNIVYLTPQPIERFDLANYNFSSLSGPGSTVNKSITWTVENIDPNYDFIEFILIKREYPEKELYTILQFENVEINGQTTISGKFVNDGKELEISLSEFLIENTTFTHCKTIDEKDNRLFFGNVSNNLVSYLDTFDTRAFRFGSSTTTLQLKKYEYDTSLTPYVIANPTTDYSLISENTDAIIPYNLGMSIADDPMYSDTKYQRNSTIVGGSGANISYKFGSLLISADEQPLEPAQAGSTATTNQGSNRDVNIPNLAFNHGYRIPGGHISNQGTGAPYQTYTTDNKRASLGIEYLNGHYLTGELNEIYRYGILFKSKTGESNFVKWIGDIKFPNYSDTVAPGLEGIDSDGGFCSDFRSMHYNNNKAYTNIPYIQFDVNIPEELSVLIASFEIVVVERKATDRTVVSQGLITQVSNGSTSNEFWMPKAHIDMYNSSDNLRNTYMAPESTVGSFSTYSNRKVLLYQGFKALVDKNADDFAINDKIIVTEKYQSVLNTALWPIGVPPATIDGNNNFRGYFYISKFYDRKASYNDDYIIKQAKYCGQRESVAFDSGKVYNNMDFAFLPATPRAYTDSTAEGNPTIVIELNDAESFIWENYNSSGSNVAKTFGNNDNSKLLAIHYRPRILENQYNGRTFQARSTNEYITTGAFYKIESSGVKSIKVFGGDIAYGVLDIQRAIKGNYFNPSGTDYSGTSDQMRTHSQTWFFPTHSIYNVDLRVGYHINSDLNTDNTAINSAYILDEYYHAITYSWRNDVVKHIPKPSNFTTVSLYDNRIYWTPVKINGDSVDSWSILPVDNYYDVSGNQGSITALITLNNNMYCLQENGISMLLINQTALIQDQNNQALQLGTGSTLQRHNYLSVDVGTKHQWSISTSPSNITFFDSLHKKIYLFNGSNLKPISDVEGHRGFVNKVYNGKITNNDNPLLGLGILTTYDYINNEFLYTFLNKVAYLEEPSINDKYTLAYSDLINKFTSFYDFTPYIYINNKINLYSLPDYTSLSTSKIYMHNKGNYGEFYGVTYPSTLKTVINDNPIYTKVFDSLSWSSNSTNIEYSYMDEINDYISEDTNIPFINNTFDKVRCYNEYENTDWTNLVITGASRNLKKTEQSFKFQIPRNKVNYDNTNINTKSIFDPSVLTKTTFGERLRDKYMIVDLNYPNTNNNRFVVNNLKTNYRPSYR